MARSTIILIWIILKQTPVPLFLTSYNVGCTDWLTNSTFKDVAPWRKHPTVRSSGRAEEATKEQHCISLLITIIYPLH